MKLLLYTDSRGNNIRGCDDYAHYPAELSRMHQVEAHLCPHRYTTTLDFLQLWQRRRDEGFDAVILHTGIVDAAPRPRASALADIYLPNQRIFDDVFGPDEVAAHIDQGLGADYEGEPTANLYSLDMARRCLLPRLRAVPNLIWIGGNRFPVGWRGNYWRDRPTNVNLLVDYFALFADHLPRVVGLADWSDDDVKRYTYDAVHPNQSGSAIILDRLRPHLEALEKMAA